MGYSYVGPTSFYRLTMQEIRRLQRGYAALNEPKEKGKTGRPRKSDWQKLNRFKKKLGLN